MKKVSYLLVSQASMIFPASDALPGFTFTYFLAAETQTSCAFTRNIF